MSGLDLLLPMVGAIGHLITEHYMDKKASKQFASEIQEAMSIYTNHGFLDPVPPSSSQPNLPVGWRTTPDKA